jgi:hypothetical protein
VAQYWLNCVTIIDSCCLGAVFHMDTDHPDSFHYWRCLEETIEGTGRESTRYSVCQQEIDVYLTKSKG